MKHREPPPSAFWNKGPQELERAQCELEAEIARVTALLETATEAGERKRLTQELTALHEGLERAQAVGGAPPARYRCDPLGWFLWRMIGPPARLKIKTTAPFVPSGEPPAPAPVASGDGEKPERGCLVRPSMSSKTTLVLFTLAACSAPPPPSPSNPSPTSLDAYARQLMAREGVNGMALAAIEDGEVTHVAAYGHRNVERDLPLTTDTVMYGASLTKTAFTHLVLQLVDEGRLDLDATVADLLPRPLPDYEEFADLAGDPRWRALTPRILLTHTTGLANFRWLEPDEKLRFHHDPGTRYGYSGEGFYIAQLILEEGLGLDVGQEMQRRVFDRFGMTRTSMRWRPDFAENLADGYALDGTVEPHDQRSRVSAAGSMDTTIADQARLWAGILRGDGLSPAARAELVRPQAPITSRHQFPTLAPPGEPQNAGIGLAAGLGLVTFRDTSGPAWFKGGHNDWTGNLVVCLESGQRCIVLLANDVRAERIYPELVRRVLGEIRLPWTWEYGWLEEQTGG